MVEGRIVEDGALARIQFSPGRGIVDVPYCLHIDTETLVEMLQPAYNEYLQEALADARNFSQHWPELASLAEAGYPDLRHLPAALPKVLARTLKESMNHDLLDAFLPFRDTASIEYLAHSIDHVVVDSRWVSVCGRAIQMRGRHNVGGAAVDRRERWAPIYPASS